MAVSASKQALAVQHDGLACDKATAAGAVGIKSKGAWTSTSRPLHSSLGCRHLTNKLMTRLVQLVSSLGTKKLSRLNSPVNYL